MEDFDDYLMIIGTCLDNLLFLENNFKEYSLVYYSSNDGWDIFYMNNKHFSTIKFYL